MRTKRYLQNRTMCGVSENENEKMKVHTRPITNPTTSGVKVLREVLVRLATYKRITNSLTQARYDSFLLFFGGGAIFFPVARNRSRDVTPGSFAVLLSFRAIVDYSSSDMNPQCNR